MAESPFSGLDYSWTAKELDSAPPSPESVEFFTGNINPSRLDAKQESVAINTEPNATAVLSNYLPTTGFRLSPEELEVLDELRRTCKDDIPALKATGLQKLRAIEALCEELASVEQALKDKERLIAIVASVVAPIRRLPVELLTRVLQFTLPALGASSRAPAPDSPFVLCKVSRLWRDIVLSNPAFWTRLFYELPDDIFTDGTTDQCAPIKEYCRRSEVFHFCLERAGAVPLLHLTIHDRCVQEPSFLPNFLEGRRGAFKFLQSQFPRCRSLALDTYPYWHHSILSELRPGVFLNLETLHLHLPHSAAHQSSVFSFAPALLHYHLSSVNPSDLANIEVPHRQLESTSIRITNPFLSVSLRDAVQAWRNFVVKCSNLRKADVQLPTSLSTIAMPGLDDDTVWASPGTWTQMKYLTRLSLEVGFGATLSTLLRGLDFPVLDFLRVQTSVGNRSVFLIAPEGRRFTEAIQHDLAFFIRLKMLCLTRVNISDQDLRSLLRLMTRLQHLSLLKGGYVRDCWFEDSRDLVSFLTIDEAGIKNVEFSPPLPHLQTLRLYHSRLLSPNHSPPAAYVNLARSRFSWMIRQTGTTSSNKLSTDAPFYSSPFQMHLLVEWEKDELYDSLKRDILGKLGHTHTRIIRVEACQAGALECVVEKVALFEY